MIITWCTYLNIDDYTYVKVKYNISFEEVLRCVHTDRMLIKPSSFIGLKREESIQLDTTKVIKIKVDSQQLGLF